jgi:hypothetical protein
MKRARHKQGSVVYDKRRRVWNYLFCENGVRRTKLIGSLRDFPTKAAAWQAAESLRPAVVVSKSIGQAHTMRELAQRYQSERMPSRTETSRVYPLLAEKPHPASLGRQANFRDTPQAG